MPNLDVYAPFDSGAGANVTEDTWRKFMLHMLGSQSGVIRGFDNGMATTGDSSGMQVKVATGQAWMRGHFGQNTAIKTVSIATSSPSNPRIDRIVLRVDFIGNTVGVFALTGTPAGSPTAPAVTQNTSLWETSLALVAVGTSVSNITAGNVTDDRVYTSSGASLARTASNPVSIATNTPTVATFTGAIHTSGDIVWDTVNSKVTLNRAGLWQVTFRIGFAANATGMRQGQVVDPAAPTSIYVYATVPAVSGINMYCGGTGTFRFPAGQQLQAIIFQNSGGNLNTDSEQLDMVWLGP